MPKIGVLGCVVLSALIFSFEGISAVNIENSNFLQCRENNRERSGGNTRNHKILKIPATIDKFRFVDGDTVGYRFAKDDCVFGSDGKPFRGNLRLLAFDTPEKMAPGLGMFYNQTCAQKASEKIKRLLTRARNIEIWMPLGRRTKGRMMAHIVYRDRFGSMKLLAAEMIRSGFAYETVSAFGNNGFPELRPLIDQAWRDSPLRRKLARNKTPQFMSPHIWRQMNLQYRYRVTRWRDMSLQERENWLRYKHPRAQKQALDYADQVRWQLIQRAERFPQSERSRETLFYLKKFPRHQGERVCR